MVLRALPSFAASASLICASTNAFADPPIVEKDHAVSVAVSGLYTVMTTSRGDASGLYSERNGANAIAARIAYRSPYAIGVFGDMGFFPIYRRDRRVDLGSGLGVANSSASLTATSFAVGISADVWRFRAGAGLTWNDLSVSSTTFGQTSHSTESDLGYTVSLAGYPVRWKRLSVGLETRMLFIAEAEVTVFSFGVTMSGDAVRF